MNNKYIAYDLTPNILGWIKYFIKPARLKKNKIMTMVNNVLQVTIVTIFFFFALYELII